eukprot:6358799-Ditylum_brightwellii.AAC.1
MLFEVNDLVFARCRATGSYHVATVVMVSDGGLDYLVTWKYHRWNDMIVPIAWVVSYNPCLL